MDAARTYGMLRQFPAALKLYDRVLDITPNNPDVMAEKAAFIRPKVTCKKPLGFLSEVNEQTPTEELLQSRSLS